jgi:hypothetical protein
VSRKAIFRVAVLAWWLLMVGWLVRFEAFPEFFTHSLPGYEGLLGQDILLSDSWMKISRDGKPAGYARINVEVNEFDSVRHVSLENRLHLDLDVLGQRQTVYAQATAYLDMMYQLQHFEFSLASDLMKMRVTGDRQQGRRFAIVTDIGGNVQRMVVEIPEDAIVQSPLTAMAVKRLRVGEQVRVHALNPLTMSTAFADIKALRRDILTLGGVPVDATVLSVEYLGTRLLAWISPSGELLREESPLGVTMEKCSAQEALEQTKSMRGTNAMNRCSVVWSAGGV